MMDRGTIMTAALASIAAQVSTRTASAQAPVSRITAYGFSFPGLDGGDIRLADFAGRPFMVVNTASLCGYTPQYAGLQELWTQFHGRGLRSSECPRTISADRSRAAQKRSRRRRSTNMASLSR